VASTTNGRADLIAAARAAAKWAHARRATWTRTPLAIPAGAVTATRPAPSWETPIAPAAAEPSRPSAAAQTAARLRAFRAPRWLPRAAAFAALGAAGIGGGIYGVRYAMDVWSASRARPAATAKPVAPRPTAQARPVKTTGSLRVSSTPSGAQVIVDGKPRGVTPLTIEEVAAGRHTIEFKSEAGSVQRTITVAANTVAEIEESIFSGFVVIFAPFELVITEGRRTLSLDERNQLMLPPGRHELRLTNRALEFETVRQVDLKPGETVTLSIAPPMSTMTVTANEPAEVWLDGARIGDAPVNEAPLTLGTHDIVVKRAAGGEKRYTVKVTAKPLTLNVEF
jgi:archaellum component FlaG (FlaF/FlaG flagellin family)